MIENRKSKAKEFLACKIIENLFAGICAKAQQKKGRVCETLPLG
jgi:hypothetical protein